MGTGEYLPLISHRHTQMDTDCHLPAMLRNARPPLGGQASLVVVIWRWDNGGQRGLGFLSRSVFLGLNFELYFRKGLRGHTMCDTIGGIP